jgi:DNA segregation ATPase FtsK/SpoIIIE, S-DNA-T family
MGYFSLSIGEMSRHSSRKTTNEHTKEIYGLIFLAMGVFLFLCLLSYEAFDPSLTSLSPNKDIHNLGGIVGSYLSDFLFNFLGYGAYLLPISLLLISFNYFALRHLQVNWVRFMAYAIGIMLFSVFSHLVWQEVLIGGKVAGAGGLTGWVVGEFFTKYFGTIGTYLVVVIGMLFAFTWATHIPLSRIYVFVQSLANQLSAKLMSMTILFWGRSLKMTRSYWRRGQSALQEWKEQRGVRRQEVKINQHQTVSASPPADNVIPLTPVTPSSHDKPSHEPKVLPREDIQLESRKSSRKSSQLEFSTTTDANFQLPSLSLLDSSDHQHTQVDEEALKANSKLLEKKLRDYGVEGAVTEIHPGPVVTMYEFVPAPGVKVNKVVNLSDDLALSMGGRSVRIVPHLAGRAAIGIEIPNVEREMVFLKDVLEHSSFTNSHTHLSLAIGKDIKGIPFSADMAKMPHLLIAGATGAGKSVALNTMILSFLYKSPPKDVRLLLVDLKMLELSIYDGIPHLLLPVVTQPKKATLALRWAVEEMERRYELMAEKKTRGIVGYNKIVESEEKLPYVVIVIDELSDLMMTSSQDVEKYITRLAQMARAAGIHLILATQRPSVDVLTGLIKANFPARISFKVTSKHDSRTIIDTVGAEHLLGSGDMLYSAGGIGKMQRIHGAYVSETEILRVVEFWKNQGKPIYNEEILQPRDDEPGNGFGDEEDYDELYDQAVSLVTETRQASISMVQRRLRIGYNRAARMIEKMEREGIVGPSEGSRPREVLAPPSAPA